MADNTPIEWTDATWNPVTGCSVVSPGCTNCYAMRLAGGRLKHVASRQGLTIDSKVGPVWNGQVRLNADQLTQPLRWRRPRRIFVCAHGDLFHESVPDDWIDQVFAVMALARQHTFQVLTKRAERMAAYFERLRVDQDAREHTREIVPQLLDDAAADLTVTHGGGLDEAPWPLPNVWLGVSAEDQPRADERIPHLLATPAAVRFLSAEPLLGAIDLTRIAPTRPKYKAQRVWTYNAMTGDQRGENSAPGADPEVVEDWSGAALDWVIAGGESGPGARPMQEEWAAAVLDQCRSAGVAFFMKQMARKAPIPAGLLVREWPR